MTLTLSWRRPLSYRNQSIDLQSKSMDWFLYDRGFRHERVKYEVKIQAKDAQRWSFSFSVGHTERKSSILKKTDNGTGWWFWLNFLCNFLTDISVNFSTCPYDCVCPILKLFFFHYYVLSTIFLYCSRNNLLVVLLILHIGSVKLTLLTNQKL